MTEENGTERLLAKTFLEAGLEISGLYQIVKRENNSIIVSHKPRVITSEKTFEIFVHTERMTPETIKEIEAKNRKEGIYTAHVFLGNGVKFKRRLEQAQKLKLARGSLREYESRMDDFIISGEEEREVAETRNNTITYIVPGILGNYTLETYKLTPAQLNYSYLPIGDTRRVYARDNQSRRWYLATLEGTIRKNEALRMKYRSDDEQKRATLDILNPELLTSEQKRLIADIRVRC